MRTKKLTLFALLGAIALVLGLLENTLLVFSIVPGGKIGVANSVTMLVFYLFSPLEALGFGVFRALLSACLYSGMTSFWYSVAGAFLSVAFMWGARNLFKDKVSEIGTSILGAVGFNIGQLAVAACVLESVQIFRYFPALGVVSAIAGLVTGYLAKNILNHLIKEF